MLLSWSRIFSTVSTINFYAEVLRKIVRRRRKKHPHISAGHDAKPPDFFWKTFKNLEKPTHSRIQGPMEDGTKLAVGYGAVPRPIADNPRRVGKFSEDAMSSAALTQVAVCETYDALVAECEAARQTWSERRAEILESGVQGKETDDELRSLQAKYAKSYPVLRNHLCGCELCQSAWGTSGGAGELPNVQDGGRHMDDHGGSFFDTGFCRGEFAEDRSYFVARAMTTSNASIE
jgi:hypothetical protein